MLKTGARFGKLQGSLGLYVGHYCSQDISLIALLGEDDYAHVRQFVVTGSVEAEAKWSSAEIFQGADALQVADNASVLKTPPTVLSIANVGRILRIDKSSIEFRVRLGGRQRRQRDRSGDLVGVQDWAGER